MNRKFYAAALRASLAAAAIIFTSNISTVTGGLSSRSDGVIREGFAYDTMVLTAHAQEVTGDTPSPDEVQDPVSSEGVSLEEYLSRKPEEDPAIRREKYYLLKALDKVEDIGASPIAIWSKVTKNEKVLNSVKSLEKSASDTVTETVSGAADAVQSAAAEKAEEVRDAVAGKAKDALEEQTEKAKKSFFEKLKEWFESL